MPALDDDPSSWPIDGRQQLARSHRPNPCSKWKASWPRVHDVELIEAKRLERAPHGRSQRWRVRAFDLETEAPLPSDNQQVELGPSVSRPKKTFIATGHQPPPNLSDQEAFPARPKFRVAKQVAGRLDPEQSMREPAIGDIELRGFDDTLPQVLGPRLQLFYHVGSR
jgi:hypothetical protein